MADSRNTRQDNTDVALLIDWENLKLGLRQQYGVTPNISSLVEAAREYGRLVLARAYADWTQDQLREDAPNLYRAGIEPIYVPGRNPISGATFKNSADIRLVVDAVEICGRLHHVGTYILVTGDADMIHGLNFLRLQGRRVVIIAVEQSLSALLSSAADNILLYERDIEPLQTRSVSATVKPVRSDIPPIQDTMQWIVDLLRERGDETPYPFNVLGNDLKQRYQFESRGWYGMPFKELMLIAEREGKVHLSTSGGMDYASLPNSAISSLPATTTPSGADDRTRAFTNGSSVNLESLSDDEWHGLLRFLRKLQADSPYMTYRFIVDRTAFHSVLPRLSREQIASLVNDLTSREILKRGQYEGKSEPGANTSLSTLTLNESDPRVRQALSAPSNPPTSSGEHARATDPFKMLLPALAEARQRSGVGYFPSVQKALEEHIGTTVRDLGYSSLSLFFAEAERRGLVRIGWYNGAHVLVRADEEVPAPVPNRAHPT
jgi:uncharacterized protein (TIGR00288 family)